MNKSVLPIEFDHDLKSDAWIGNDTFIPHLRCFGEWRTDVKIVFADPIFGDGPGILKMD